MRVYVVTKPENGWDCVYGVYQAESEKVLKKYLMEERGFTDEEKFDNMFVIHDKELDIVNE